MLEEEEFFPGVLPSNALSSGAIFGIVMGVLLSIAAITLIGLVVWKRCFKPKKPA